MWDLFFKFRFLVLNKFINYIFAIDDKNIDLFYPESDQKKEIYFDSYSKEDYESTGPLTDYFEIIYMDQSFYIIEDQIKPYSLALEGTNINLFEVHYAINEVYENKVYKQEELGRSDKLNFLNEKPKYYNKSILLIDELNKIILIANTPLPPNLKKLLINSFRGYRLATFNISNLNDLLVDRSNSSYTNPTNLERSRLYPFEIRNNKTQDLNYKRYPKLTEENEEIVISDLSSQVCKIGDYVNEEVLQENLSRTKFFYGLDTLGTLQSIITNISSLLWLLFF